MKLALIILCPLLALSLAYNVWLNWCLDSAHDHRPAGRFLRLRSELPIYARGKTDQVATLPAGLLLQESTPHGVATLGKVDGQEFLLVIHSKGGHEDAFEAANKTTGGNFWVPFSFDPNDHNIFQEPPYDDPDAGR